MAQFKRNDRVLINPIMLQGRISADFEQELLNLALQKVTGVVTTVLDNVAIVDFGVEVASMRVLELIHVTD